jgi:hypothetical protein
MPDSVLTAKIRNEFVDQLAVGNYIVKVGSSHGAVVNAATEENQTTVHSRSTPILMLPHPCKKLVNRQETIKAAIATLQSGQSVEFHGPAGYGKSSLIRYLAHSHQLRSSFPDGVISLSPLHPYVDDILQSIWEAFYEADNPYKQVTQQIYQQLKDKQALVVLDEDKLIKQDLEELMHAASKCTFLVASSTSRIRQGGVSIMLSGLSSSDALTFVEGELQRSLTPEELPSAQLLCTVLSGHPMHIQLVIASILANGKSITEVVGQLPTSAPRDYLIQQIGLSLSQPQRNILTLLVVMNGVGLQSEQIIAITQQPDALTILEELQRRRLVQFNGTHYSVSKAIVEVLPSEWKATKLEEQVIAYFTKWAERYRQQPKSLLLEIDVIVQIIDLALKSNRWQDVLRLVQAIEGAIALSRRWILWERVLLRGLQASHLEQDQAAEAWALHQLGTCALCLEDNTRATHYLTKALQLRESLDDEIGLSVTRHNFNLLNISPVDQTKSHSVVDTVTQLNTVTQIDQPQHSSNPQTEPVTQIDQPQHFSNPQTEPVTQIDQPQHSSNPQTEPVTLILPVAQPLTENPNNPQSPASQHLLTRMNVVIEDALPPNQPFYKADWLSSKALIATGILASGGLLAWFNWHRFTPTPTSSTNEPKTTPIPLPITKNKSKKVAKPSNIAKPIHIPNITFPPLIEPTPGKVEPPLPEPKFDYQPPSTDTKNKANNRKQSKPRPTSAPSPTVLSTVTPTDTLTPAPTPEVSQPIPEATSTPTFTPIPTPTQTPQAEVTPNSTFSQTAIPQAEAAPNSTFSPNGIVVPIQERGLYH